MAVAEGFATLSNPEVLTKDVPTTPGNMTDEMIPLDEILPLLTEVYLYLDNEDDWLNAPSLVYPTQVKYMKMSDWLSEPFDQVPRSTQNALVDKLDELSTFDANRTFPRQSLNERRDILKETITKRIVNGRTNSVREEESSPTAAIHNISSREYDSKSYASPKMSSTFSLEDCDKFLERTFTKDNGDLTYVEEIARRQEDTLSRRCLNQGSAGNMYDDNARFASPVHASVNNGTITKRPKQRAYDPSDDMQLLSQEQLLGSLYEQQACSPDPALESLHFLDHHQFTSSTPYEKSSRSDLSSFQRNGNFRANEAPLSAPKIMPDVVSNLRANGGNSWNGRSMPNLARKLTVNGGMQSTNHAPPSVPASARNPYPGCQLPNSSYVPNSGTITKGSTRAGLPRKPAIDGSNSMYRVNQQSIHYGGHRLQNQMPPNHGAPLNKDSFSMRHGGISTNLTRKATFRVRQAEGTQSEENLARSSSRGSNYSDGDFEESVVFSKCGPLRSVTNIRDEYSQDQDSSLRSSASTELAQRTYYKSIETSQRSTKIPGPKSVRSGIPSVAGSRPAFLPSTSNRVAPSNGLSHQADDKSWTKRGCY